MSKKEEFKLFVKKNPNLIRFVKTGEMSWQKFFEVYSLYGENDDVWNKYFTEEDDSSSSTKENVSLSDLVDMVKKIDLNNVQKNITNINKALGLVQSLIAKDDTTSTDTYTPRPLYKKFED